MYLLVLLALGAAAQAVVLTSGVPQTQPLFSCSVADVGASCHSVLKSPCFNATKTSPEFTFAAPTNGAFNIASSSTGCADTSMVVIYSESVGGVCAPTTPTAAAEINLELSQGQQIKIFLSSSTCDLLGSSEVTVLVTPIFPPHAPQSVYSLDTSQVYYLPGINEIIVVGSARLFTVGAYKNTSRPFSVSAAQALYLPRGVSAVTPGSLLLSPTDTFFQLQLLISADELENLQGENANFFSNYARFPAQYEDGDQELFHIDLPISLQLVSVVVNPSIYTYSLEIGTTYTSLELSPSPISEVLNPLCSDTLDYVAESCSPEVISFPNTTRTSGSIPPNQGVGNKLEFYVNLTAIPKSTNMFLPARNISTCIRLYMSLDPMNVTFVRTVDLEIKLLETCPPGTSSSSGTNDLGCVACQERYYQVQAGSTQCVPVSAGSEVSADKSSLVECPVGTYSNTQTERCTKCALGTYSDDTGSSVCKPCPSATLPATLFLGSTSIDNCTTDERQASYKSAKGEPVKCPVGTTCNFPGATIETIKLLPGYYRTGDQSLDIRECKTGFCVPPPENGTATRRRRLAEEYDPANDTKYCTIHHQGHLCEICEPGYIHRGAQRICEMCLEENNTEDAGKMAGIFFALAIAAAVVCFVVISRFYRYYQPKPFTSLEHKQEEPELDVRWRTLAYQRVSAFLYSIDIGGTPFKITIGYYQVVAGMALGLGEFLPKYFKQFADVFSLLSLDFVKVFDFGCSLPEQSHRSSLLFATLTPIGFLFVLFCMERVTIKRVVHREALHVGFMNLYLWTLFLIYPSISKTIFQTFSCETFDDGFSSIKIDPQISCNSDVYTSIFTYGIFCVIFYVIGVPALFYYLLHKQRFQLDACPEFEAKVSLAYREKNVSVQSTRMLWHSYVPKRYNYEVFELGRKLFQTSVFVFVSQDSAAQVIFLLVTCAVVVVLLSWLDPYVRQTHNALAQWAQWNIFTIAFVALLNRMEIATANEEVALDMLLLICLVSVPILALVIGIDWSWLGRKLGRYYAHVSHFLKRTREFNKSSSFKPDASAVNQRLNDKIVHSAVEELQQSINLLANKIDQNTKDKMLIIVDGLDKKYREESEVSRVERSILLNDASEKGHLKKRVVELIEENDHLKYTKAFLEEQVKQAGDQFERDVQNLDANSPATTKRPSGTVTKKANHRPSIVESAKKVTDMFFFANPVTQKDDIRSLAPMSASTMMPNAETAQQAPSLMFSRVMAESVSSSDSKTRFAKSTSGDRKV